MIYQVTKKKKKKAKKTMQGSWAQEFFIYLYIGPMTQAEDNDLSKKEKSSSEEPVLINKEFSFGHNGS